MDGKSAFQVFMPMRHKVRWLLLYPPIETKEADTQLGKLNGLNETVDAGLTFDPKL